MFALLWFLALTYCLGQTRELGERGGLGWQRRAVTQPKQKEAVGGKKKTPILAQLE